MNTNPTAPRGQRLTRQQVTHAAGGIAEETIAAILATGAKPVELETAVAWATGESEMLDRTHPLQGRAAAIYDLLIADPGFAAPERDR